MNKLELRSYLESIYNVKIASVHTQNILGAHACIATFCVMAAAPGLLFVCDSLAASPLNVCVCCSQVRRSAPRHAA